VHSMTSGRANSLTGLGPSALMDPPGLAPGLFILGSVPAIIRCWLDTNFKHDTLLYATVCSGSYTSYVDLHLIESLGLQDQIVSDEGVRKIKISIYLPEAVPVFGSSRSNSPARQLPSVAVEFTIKEEYDAEVNAKPIQIFLGSDMLRAHAADLLFSSNQLTLYDEDHCKLQIPFVRPEDERTFKSLSISSKPLSSAASQNILTPYYDQSKLGAVGDTPPSTATRDAAPSVQKLHGSGTTSSEDGGSVGRRSLEQRPRIGLSISNRSSKEAQDSPPSSAVPRSGAMQSNWRRDSAEKPSTGSLDWANVGKTTISSTNYKPRDTKVFRAPRSATRTLSTSSPATSQSRYFDDGKRRGEEEVSRVGGEKAENVQPVKIATTTPGSAFSWLSGGSK
jgi:ubiquitin carboxyl-terminal hydrolase 4/11/15